MNYFKETLASGDIKLYVINYAEQTISRLTWTREDIIRYRGNYGFENKDTVEAFEEITEDVYLGWVEAVNTAMRIGSTPVKPPN